MSDQEAAYHYFSIKIDHLDCQKSKGSTVTKLRDGLYEAWLKIRISREICTAKHPVSELDKSHVKTFILDAKQPNQRYSLHVQLMNFNPEKDIHWYRPSSGGRNVGSCKANLQITLKKRSPMSITSKGGCLHLKRTTAKRARTVPHLNETATEVDRPVFHQKTGIRKPSYVYMGANMENLHPINEKSLVKWETWRSVSINYEKDEGEGDGEFIVWIEFQPSPPRPAKILSEVAELFNCQKMCDIKFVLSNGGSIGAHTFILKAVSPVFFNAIVEEAKSGQVKISDGSVEVFRHFLSYIYTGEAPDFGDVVTVQKVYELAGKYDVEMLAEECILAILPMVNVSNAISLLKWSQLHMIAEVYESVLKTIDSSRASIFALPQWQTLKKQYPDLYGMVVREIGDSTVQWGEGWYNGEAWCSSASDDDETN